eukprot:CAMPEP_0185735008 /NCGR_PEP_ID=MMETSP1171-20130828/24103_1 /TAXON_ID=374046 /ORGANISM="Helicotheca tamensis, Strain CCMP826" /LENGTH=118 /DNA_ID=CAMNT_0028405169 /DNA_START=182 /DNA_END=534 /DNA_ORIENTATION=+
MKDVIKGDPIDPAPLIRIQDAVAELMQNIRICVDNFSLGQLFFSPPRTYVKPVEADDRPAPMKPRTEAPQDSSQTRTPKSEQLRKKRQAEKEGWLSKATAPQRSTRYAGIPQDAFKTP